MNKSELLAALEASRADLLALIDDLTDLELIEPGVMDDWSVKDILAHLAAWEAELVKLLAQARTGKRPAFLDLGRTDDLNAKWYKENRNRPLDRVMADFAGVRKQTIRQIGSYSDKELTDAEQYNWLRGKPLTQWIADDTFEHEAEHTEHIRHWKRHRAE